MAERDGAEHERYGDWRSLELAIKAAAKNAARQAGPGISAASVDAQIRQARFDRFLCRPKMWTSQPCTRLISLRRSGH
jgi:hypothetical protein